MYVNGATVSAGGANGSDVSSSLYETQAWWNNTLGWSTSQNWGGTNEAYPWKMGTVNSRPRPVLWFE